MGQRRYKAFISYSHRDAGVARWLHHALETYAIPSVLVGRETAYGPVPRRLSPIFKDREELAAADSLGAAVDAALKASDALIVLCSPDGARSPWVDQEVHRYKQIHGEGRVFAALVGGEPEDSFPPALRVRYRDGAPTDEAAEPIAADLRAEGDGRKLGKLKLVAGLTGVELDQLVRRDGQRRQRRLAMVAAASLIGMATTSGLALYAVDQRDEARAQRAEADGLIEYMLTDLRGKLEPVGKLDVLDGVGRRALDYYARQKLADLSADELGRRAKAMQLVAEVGDLRGHNDDARRAFEEAARTTRELLDRDPDNWQRVFDHAQSEFWLAYADNLRGDDRAALPHFVAYRDLAQRLVALDPNRLESKNESASADVNLGVALVSLGRGDEAVPSFDRAAKTFESIQPRTRDIALNLAQAYAHKASHLFSQGDNAASIQLREQQLKVLSSAPLQAGDREAEEARGIVQNQIGIALLTDGNVGAALKQLADARRTWDELRAVDTHNKFWESQGLANRIWAAAATAVSDRSAGLAEFAATAGGLRALLASSKDTNPEFNLLRLATFREAIGGGWTADESTLLARLASDQQRMEPDRLAILGGAMVAEAHALKSTNATKAGQRLRDAAATLARSEQSSWSRVQAARLAAVQGHPLSAQDRAMLRTRFGGLFAAP